MKNITSFFLIISAINIFYPQISQIDDSIIVWDEKRPLTWNDFKIKEKDLNKNGEAGKVSLNLKIIFKYDAINNLQYEIIPMVNPYKSSSVVKYESNYGLQHEQLHFDIVKLFAIKIEKLYKKYNDIKNYQRIFDSISTELKKTQIKYDKETAHSILAFNQKLWEYNIHNELQKYDYYKIKFNTNKCKNFHNGNYKYEYEGDTVYIKRKNNVQFVTYKQSKLKLKQKIKWLSNCVYLVYKTDYIFLPKYTNFFPNEQILVKVINIAGNVYKVEYVSDMYNELHVFNVYNYN